MHLPSPLIVVRLYPSSSSSSSGKEEEEALIREMSLSMLFKNLLAFLVSLLLGCGGSDDADVASKSTSWCETATPPSKSVSDSETGVELWTVEEEDVTPKWWDWMYHPDSLGLSPETEGRISVNSEAVFTGILMRFNA